MRYLAKWLFRIGCVSGWLGGAAFLVMIPLIASGTVPFFSAPLCWALLMLGIVTMQIAAVTGLLAEGVPPEEWGRRLWSRPGPRWSLMIRDWQKGPFS